MMRVFLLLSVLFWAAVAPVLSGPARAAVVPADGSAPSAAAIPPLSATDARQALAVLRDPRQRAMVEHTLDAIIRAGSAAPAAAPAASKPAPATPAPAVAAKQSVQLNPNGLGVLVLVGASRFFTQLYSRVFVTLQSAQSLPLLWGWIVVMATNPLERGMVQDAAWRVVVVFLLALGAEFASRRVLRRPLARLDLRMAATGGPDPAEEPSLAAAAALRQEEEAAGADEEGADDGGAIVPAPIPVDVAPGAEAEALAEEGQTEPLSPRARGRMRRHFRLRRLGLAVVRFVLDLLPVLVFALVGHLLGGSPLAGSAQARLVILALVDSYALWRFILCLGRMLFAPEHRSSRLLRMADPAAAWASRWLARIAAVAVFGYGIGQVGLLLGLSQPAYEGLMKILGLVNHIFLAVMVLQKRRVVRRWLRAPEGSHGPFARLRNTLAPVWHWIALALLAGEWLVWAVELRNGYSAMIRTFVLVALVATGARIALTELHGALERAMHPRPEIAERYPGLEARLARYHPILSALVQTLVLLAALGVLLELMGVAVVGWVAGSMLGQRLASSIGTIAVTVMLALAVWEGVNASLQRHLARLAREQHAARAARLRTLVPLLRAALISGIGAIAGLTVLSQIGINIAPLLAGAGIIGVAIGFGSQKLVQDLITGIFLLLENAMQVGDWVTVSGLSGSVENLSVRTIRLRAGDGSVHIIPFSAVTSVTNTNRGLGNAAVLVTVSFAEDTDRVGAELKAIADAMRQERPYSTMMLSDLQLWGVDKVDGAAVTLTGQIPCTDTGRWPVQREFNRRVKRRFQELGITLYNPSQSLLIAPPPGPGASVATAPADAAGGPAASGGAAPSVAPGAPPAAAPSTAASGRRPEAAQ